MVPLRQTYCCVHAVGTCPALLALCRLLADFAGFTNYSAVGHVVPA